MKKDLRSRLGAALRANIRLNKFRQDTVMVTAAMAVYNLSFFLIPVVLSRFSRYHDVGVWSLVSAFAVNFAMIAQFSTNALQLTDAERRFTDGTFLRLRFLTIAAAFVLFVPLVFALDFSPQTRLCALAMMLYKAGESVVVTIHSACAPRRRYELGAASTIFKSIACFAAFTAGVLTASLFLGIILMAVVYGLLTMLYDNVIIRAKINWDSALCTADFPVILKRSFPVLFSGCALSFQLFFTRYIINRLYTDSELGGYSLVTQFMTIFPVIISPLIGTITIELADRKNKQDYHDLLRIISKVFVCIIASCLALCLFAWLFGDEALVLLFGGAIRPYTYLLLITVITGGVIMLHQFLATLITAIKENHALIFSSVAGLLVSFFFTQPAIIRWGFAGSCYAIIAALLAQILCLAVFLIIRYRAPPPKLF